MDFSAYDGDLYDVDVDDQEDEFEGDNDVGEYEYEYKYYSDSNASIQLSCDTCEREFADSYSYKKHMSEHRTCGIDDCTFTAHEKIIEKHITMQHTTGLYDRIRNLSTPEDVAKWIAERKRKYPNKENIEKRYKKQEEMFKRGERIQKGKDRFGRKNRVRLDKPDVQSNRKNLQETNFMKNIKKSKKVFKKQIAPESLIDDHSDWNGSLFPFRGTSELYELEKKVGEQDEFDDDEWIDDSKPKTPIMKLCLNNALGALMGAYNSSDESDLDVKPEPLLMVETKVPLEFQSSNAREEILNDLKKSNSDDEAPLEEKIIRNPLDISVPVIIGGVEDSKNDQIQVSPEKNKRKRIRHKVNGKFKRQRRDNKSATKNVSNEGECFITRKFRKRKATLLEKLLEGEIRHERNVLLQCVRFVVDNNYFSNESIVDKK